MGELEVLVFELITVDALPAGSVRVREVATLHHESGYHPMEDTVQKVKWLTFRPFAVLPSAERSEILSCLWGNVLKELHCDSLGLSFANFDVEVDFGVFRVAVWFFSDFLFFDVFFLLVHLDFVKHASHARFLCRPLLYSFLLDLLMRVSEAFVARLKFDRSDNIIVG